MKPIRLLLTAIAITVLPLAAQAADAALTPNRLTDKSGDELRQELQAILKWALLWYREDHKGHAQIVYDRARTLKANKDELVVEFANAQLYGPGPTTGIFDYRVAYVDLTRMWCFPYSVTLPGKIDVRYDSHMAPVGQRLCDVLFTLAQQSLEEQAITEARFAEEAARTRTSGAKPPVSEEVRRLIVQAEFLRERKDYAGAVERFGKVIDLAPAAYPAAYFNLALLYEQQDMYTRAIAAMRKYLILQPDAPDARAAQDKIYGWEMLTGQN